METVEIIALSMGAAWASGINLYAAILVLGHMGATGNIALPPDLQVLTSPMVLGAAALMYCVEFFADKTPVVDSAWDAIHSFIRIPAGAILAAGAVGEISQAAELTAFLLGGTLAAGAHATKAGTRVLINTSPEPVTNWSASIAEDVAVIGGMWAALHYPMAFLAVLGIMVLLMAWLLPKLWQGIKEVARRIARFFGRDDGDAQFPSGERAAPAPERKPKLPEP